MGTRLFVVSQRVFGASEQRQGHRFSGVAGVRRFAQAPRGLEVTPVKRLGHGRQLRVHRRLRDAFLDQNGIVNRP